MARSSPRKNKTKGEKIADRIKALKAMTQERGWTEGEARAAAMKAKELADKYLAETEDAVADPVEDVEVETQDGGDAEWEQQLETIWAHEKRIRAAWQEVGLGGIQKMKSFIKTGNALIDAKKDAKLRGWSWLEMLEEHEGSLPFRRSKAEGLMKIARNRVLINPNNIGKLPDHWATLTDLTQIRDDDRLQKLIDDGKIHPEMTRADARKLIGYGDDKLSGVLRTLIWCLGERDVWCPGERNMSAKEFAYHVKIDDDPKRKGGVWNKPTNKDFWSVSDLEMLEGDPGYLGQIGRFLRERLYEEFGLDEYAKKDPPPQGETVGPELEPGE